MYGDSDEAAMSACYGPNWRRKRGNGQCLKCGAFKAEDGPCVRCLRLRDTEREE